MKTEAIVFDIYGTLIDIETDEGDIKTYEEIAQFLAKYDFHIKPRSLKDSYFQIQKKWVEKKREGEGIKYPEVRIVDVFKEILLEHTVCPKNCPDETIGGLSETLPLLFRQLTIRRKNLLPHVRPTLE